MPHNPQKELREVAAQFSEARTALAEAQRVPVAKYFRAPLQQMTVRAAKLQSLIQHAGGMVDGARKFFSKSFGVPIEEAVPMASPAIDIAIQSSVTAMNYFLRDAEKLTQAISEKQAEYDALPPEQKKALGESEPIDILADDVEVTAKRLPFFSKEFLIAAGFLGLCIYTMRGT